MLEFRDVHLFNKEGKLGIHKEYFGKLLNFSIDYGEIVGILGNSESGKTSLLKAALAQNLNYDGNIFYNGKPLKGFSHIEKEKYLKKARYFTQSEFEMVKDSLKLKELFRMYLNPQLGEGIGYLEFEMHRYKTELKQIRIINEEVLERPLSQLPFEIQNLVTIYLNIQSDSELILLDDPFANLSAISTNIISEMLEHIKFDRQIIIFSNRATYLEDICDKIIKI
jgi:ABC-type multidrug transport system ATPase subunit